MPGVRGHAHEQGEEQRKVTEEVSEVIRHHDPVHVERVCARAVAEEADAEQEEEGRHEPKEQNQNGVEGVGCEVNDDGPEGLLSARVGES